MKKKLKNLLGKKPLTFSPGSPEAVSKGCTCPVILNCCGLGYRKIKNHYVINVNCFVHKTEHQK
jgi:hypothetical protein